MVTGVYVEQATEMANLDATRRVATEICELFESELDGHTEGITWEIFETKLADERMLEYFEDINVGLSHASVLFSLLDVDRSGSVDTDEMIDGLIRLVGNAKALDLKLVHYELCLTRKEAKAHFHGLQNLIASLQMKLDKVLDHTRISMQDQSSLPRSIVSNLASIPSRGSFTQDPPFFNGPSPRSSKMSVLNMKSDVSSRISVMSGTSLCNSGSLPRVLKTASRKLSSKVLSAPVFPSRF